jgi:erythromycin esterase-like protein
MKRAVPLVMLAMVALVTIAATDAPSPVTLWMKRSARPFDTCMPSEKIQDLRALRDLVGNARIVALGEGTHGTREFFQLKHRITQYLATDMGFTVFAIEANLPEAWKVNDYVLGGPGDPRALLDGMYFWTWNTEEVLEMVEWMRHFNASKRGRIEFTGFDMQAPDTAAAIVRRFLAGRDPAWADSVDRALKTGPRDPGFVTSTGTLPPSDFRGRKVRYTGFMRTENVTQFAGLWMRADAGSTPAVAFDNMQSQRVNGTHDWKRYAIELTIPANTTNINFGVLMAGEGTAWFDSLAIELDGKPWRPDSIDLALERAPGPRGLGRYTMVPRYSIAMDSTVARVGARSLRLAGRPATDDGGGVATLETARRLVEHLEASRSRLAQSSTPAQADWAIRNAHVVYQWARGRVGNLIAVRDSSMAANVRWIADEARRGSKVVLWAHNAHVAKNPGRMGQWLADHYGKDMVVIGFATNDGGYTAFTDGGLRSDNVLQPGPPHSLEAYAHATGLPCFLLDLRAARKVPEVEPLLTSGVTMRSIGAMAMEVQFSETPVLDRFDVLAWVDHTGPTRCFKVKTPSPTK